MSSPVHRVVFIARQASWKAVDAHYLAGFLPKRR
jgi:hypothetical protein